MTTLTVFADASDGNVESGFGTPYSVVAAGTALFAQSTIASGDCVGQAFSSGSGYVIAESFFSFDTSVLGSSAVISAVVLSLFGSYNLGDLPPPTTDFTAEARLYDFGATLTTADWIAAANLASHTLLASFPVVGSGGWSKTSYNNFTESGTAFRDNINKTGRTRLVVNSDRHRAQTAPSGWEMVGCYFSEQSGTANDPKLVITTVRNLVGSIAFTGSVTGHALKDAGVSASLAFALSGSGHPGEEATGGISIAFDLSGSGHLVETHPSASTAGDSGVRIGGFATPTIDAPPVTPPDGHVYLKRASQIMPAPVLMDNGWPDPDQWLPTDEIIEDWGSFQTFVGGRDVSFWAGIPAQVGELVDTEPFGDGPASITFPQLSRFVARPSWLADGANVEVYRRSPSAQKVVPLFEGMIVDIGDADIGTVVQCIGALYQLDFWLRQPVIYERGYMDLGTILSTEIDPDARDRQSFRCHKLPKVATGIQRRWSGSWQGTLTGWIADLLAQAQDASGQQWTILKGIGRRPVLRLKDRTTHHWTMRYGQHGIVVNLHRDITTAPNVIYGEGTDGSGCHWANMKWPNLRPDDAPVFPGTIMHPGNSYGDDFLAFEREMYARGWTGFDRDGTYGAAEKDDVVNFQLQAGISPDGDVGPQTWAAAFEVGSGAGDLAASYMAPLAAFDPVREFNHDPQGAETTHNLLFDPRIPRVERYESFGPSRMTKNEGIASAKQEVARDYPNSYAGTITLTADPNQGSRFEIRAGQNFFLQGYEGVDRLLHIAERKIDTQSDPITVRLTVDEKARDRMTLAAILSRSRESSDPSRRKAEYRNRRSKLTSDSDPIFDCENGAGIIPRHATYRGLWNVLRIPTGRTGTIVRARFSLDVPALFAVGLFDRPVTAAQLVAVGPDGPLQTVIDADGADAVFWDTFPDPDDREDPRRATNNIDGLVAAWGAPEEPGGLSPYVLADNKPITGKLVDNGSWNYVSQRSFWLWVAIYVGGEGDGAGPVVNYIEGRLEQSNTF